MVSPKSVSLNVPDPAGSNADGFDSTMLLTATVTMSDGQTHSVVTWSTSDGGRVTVGAGGWVSVVDGALPGVVTITASVGGPQGELSDSATVTVTNLGGLTVIVE